MDTISSNQPRATNGRGFPACNRYALGTNLAVLFCPTSNGKLFGVSIDRSDLERVLAAGLWHVANFCRKGKGFRLYAYTSQQGKIVYLHRFLSRPAPKQYVDHRNRRGTDNRSANRRCVSGTTNQLNRTPCVDSRSGVRGVTWSSRHNKWIAKVRAKQLGTFSDPEQAKRSVDSYLKALGI